MKTLVFVLGLLVTGSNTLLAQCGKKTTLVSSKTEYLDSTGAVQQTTNE